MRKAYKVALLLLSHVAVVVLGIIGGHEFVRWNTEAGYRQDQIEAGGWPLLVYLTDNLEQPREQDAEAYKDALVDLSTVLAQRRDSGSPPISGTMYHTVMMVSHTLISQLETAAGRPEASEQRMNLAVEECAASKWDDCATETVIRFSASLERPIQRGLFRPLFSGGSEDELAE